MHPRGPEEGAAGVRWGEEPSRLVGQHVQTPGGRTVWPVRLERVREGR